MGSLEIDILSNLDEVARDFGRDFETVERKAQQAINRVGAKLRTKSARRIQEVVGAKAGAKRRISGKIVLKKAGGPLALTATITFSESGIGVEQSNKATVRKVRGHATAVRVTFRGKQLKGTFRLPGKTQVLMRTGGRVKRVFSFTALQEAEKANLFEEIANEAPDLVIAEFFRLLKF